MEFVRLIQSFITLFAIVDPVGVIPLFLLTTRGFTVPQQRRAARIAAMTVWMVLVAFTFAGESILHFFAIRLEAFTVAGGFLLLMLASSMLQAHVSPLKQTPEEAVEAEEKEAVGAVPLGIPLLAGPGAITHVIVLAGQAPDDWLQKSLLLLPISGVALIVWLCFYTAPALSQRLGRSGIYIVTRLMGLVIAAMSVEMLARGLLALFPGLAT